MNAHSGAVNAPVTKRCPSCGGEYPDTLTVCVIDHSSLVLIPANPEPIPESRKQRRLFAFWPSSEHSLGGVWMRSLILTCSLCYGAKIWAMNRRIAFPEPAEYLGLCAMFILFFSSLLCIGSNNRWAIAGFIVIALGLIWFVPVLRWLLFSS
jgi:hypothetical protein